MCGKCEKETDPAKCLLSKINKIDDDSKVPDDVSIDSGDEYVKESNYSKGKQQRQMVEEVRNHHYKRKRRRPKRKLFETQDFFVENIFEDVGRKKKTRRRHRTASSTRSEMSTEPEHIPFSEGHDNSDIESDHEFDTMSRNDCLGYDSASSDDGIDLGDFSNVNQYERSVNRFEGGLDDDSYDNDLLQNGLDLSHTFIEEHILSSHNKSHFTYPEFYSKEKCEELCKKNPLKYKKCTVKIMSSHGAVCKPLDHSDNISEIEISGRSKIGKVFNDDEVYVEVLDDERESYKDKKIIPRLQKTLDLSKMSLKVYGQIRGISKRHHFPNVDHPVFVCVLDECKFHLMLPVSKTVPKLHILNQNCQNMYQVDMYTYVRERGELNDNELFNIKPGEIKNYIFLVAMVCWENLYPLGAVIKVINAKDGLTSGMEILRLQHQVPTGYNLETVENVKRLLEQEGRIQDKSDRKDLTELEVFTIDPPNSKDLDDALSIERLSNGHFKVGVHISDVSDFVKKGDYIDHEAYERATTFYPGQGRNPFHMLPEPLSTNLCSLLPGSNRMAITIFYKFDKDGKSTKKPEIVRSTIKSRQQLTYRDAEDVLHDIESNVPESLRKQIKDLFKLAKSIRTKRLGGKMYYVPVETDNDDDFIETKEAHCLVDEFMILANHTIGTYLFNTFRDCIPLRIQQPPDPENVQQWLYSNRFIADLILNLRETRPLPLLESERKLAVSNARTGNYNNVLNFQQHIWKKLLKAVESQNSSELMQILACDDNHPFALLALEEWYEFQETAEYKCSGEVQTKCDGSHFDLGMFAYIHSTSPIRRYVDLISHRLLQCALDKQEPCYSMDEISEKCSYINEVTRRAKAYQTKCLA